MLCFVLAGSHLFLPPNRYVFSGAEFLQNLDDLSDGDLSSSSSSTSSNDEAEQDGDVSRDTNAADVTTSGGAADESADLDDSFFVADDVEEETPAPAPGVDDVVTTHNSDREPGATGLQKASTLTAVADVNMDNSSEQPTAADTCTHSS